VASDRLFVLGLDLDGVCADFYRGMRRIAAEWCGKSENELTEEVEYGLPQWKLKKAGGDYKSLQSHSDDCSRRLSR